MNPFLHHREDLEGAGLSYHIRVRYPNGQEVSFDSDRHTCYIGRSRANDIRLPHTFVSSRHLRLSLHRQGFTVTDLGSTEGTKVNGQRLEPHVPHRMADESRLEIGPLRLFLEPILEASVVEDSQPRRLSSSPESSRGVARRQPWSGIEAPLWELQKELNGRSSEDRSLGGRSPGGQSTGGRSPGEPSLGSSSQGDPRAPSKAPPRSHRWSPPGTLAGVPQGASTIGGKKKFLRIRPPQPPVDVPWILMLEIVGGVVAFAALALLIAVLLV